MELPKHILTAAKNNQTSLGDNPCLPPEEEETFIVKLLTAYYSDISKHFDKNVNEDELKNELSSLITKCKKNEKENIVALEQICMECINEMFDIPEETIDIKCKLSDKIDTNVERLVPEKDMDYSFEDINDMNMISGEIYKRRVLNSLISGAALYYAKNFKPYFQKVFDIDSELPSLYKKIMQINDVLLFLTKDALIDENCDGGKVDVFISNDNMVNIESEGLIFPILLSETIKGILELAISHGLPENREKAMYVIGKSDFKLAEVWDMRLGCPLWEIIVSECEELGYDVQDIGINFLLMSFALMNVDEFNEKMKEIFAKTKRGKSIINNIITDIIRNKEQDEFDDFIQTQKNNNIPINDDDYFEADELIMDSVY